VQVHHGRQVQEAVGDSQVGDVADPSGVRPGGGEVAAQQVRGGLRGRIAAGGGVPAAQVAPDESVLAHEPLHPLVVHDAALRAQLHGDPRGPVGGVGVGVDLADLFDSRSSWMARAARPVAPASQA
jgi:hypothetical protein